MQTSKLRHMLRAFERTPLHPQWLAYAAKRGQARWVQELSRGSVVNIGCADDAVRALVESHVHRYVSVDYPATGGVRYGARPMVWADAQSLPIADASADVVLLLDVLEHISEPALALEEIARILRPGGKLLLAVPFLYPLHDVPHDFHRWTEFGLHKAVADAGLAIDSCHRVGSAAASGASTLAIGLAQSALELVERPRFASLLLPLFVLLIVGVNITGWLGNRTSQDRQLAPLRYHVVARNDRT